MEVGGLGGGTTLVSEHTLYCVTIGSGRSVDQWCSWCIDKMFGPGAWQGLYHTKLLMHQSKEIHWTHADTACKVIYSLHLMFTSILVVLETEMMATK